MPLHALHALHFEAACEGCTARSRLVCTPTLPTARREAVALLESEGWRHAVDANEKTRAWMEREGAGRWMCPACARGNVKPP